MVTGAQLLVVIAFYIVALIPLENPGKLLLNRSHWPRYAETERRLLLLSHILGTPISGSKYRRIGLNRHIGLYKLTQAQPVAR